jgi:hypothetical protein
MSAKPLHLVQAAALAATVACSPAPQTPQKPGVKQQTAPATQFSP